MREGVPTPISSSGERRKEQSPIRDIAVDRENMVVVISYDYAYQKQTMHEGTQVLLYVLVCCSTWWVGECTDAWGAIGVTSVFLPL